MKRLLFAVIATVVAVPASAGDVSASIGISQPGFYGQINIGDVPRPTVIYAQPVWIQRPPKVGYVQPIYVRVPPGHEKHWGKHCAEYGACGRPSISCARTGIRPTTCRITKPRTTKARAKVIRARARTNRTKGPRQRYSAPRVQRQADLGSSVELISARPMIKGTI